MKPYLDLGIFQELKDLNLFKTVRTSFDSIEWDNEADFDPENALKRILFGVLLMATYSSSLIK